MITQYIQRVSCETTELDGEWIILNTDQYTITKLNGVGGFCWSLLDEAQTVASLTQHVSEKFPISDQSEAVVKKDIEQFLGNLVECGLIQHVD